MPLTRSERRKIRKLKYLNTGSAYREGFNAGIAAVLFHIPTAKPRKKGRR